MSTGGSNSGGENYILGMTPTQLKNIYDFITKKHPNLAQVMEKFLPDVSSLHGGIYIKWKDFKDSEDVIGGRSHPPELTSIVNFDLAMRLSSHVQLTPGGPRILWGQAIETTTSDPYQIALNMKYQHVISNGPVERLIRQMNLPRVETNMDKVMVFYEWRPSAPVSLGEIGPTGCTLFTKMEYSQLCFDADRHKSIGVKSDYLISLANKDETIKPVTGNENRAPFSRNKVFSHGRRAILIDIIRKKSLVQWRDFRFVKVIKDPIWITYMQRQSSVEDLNKFNLAESERKDLVATRCDLLENESRNIRWLDIDVLHYFAKGLQTALGLSALAPTKDTEYYIDTVFDGKVSFADQDSLSSEDEFNQEDADENEEEKDQDMLCDLSSRLKSSEKQQDLSLSSSSLSPSPSSSPLPLLRSQVCVSAPTLSTHNRMFVSQSEEE